LLKVFRGFPPSDSKFSDGTNISRSIAPFVCSPPDINCTISAQKQPSIYKITKFKTDPASAELTSSLHTQDLQQPLTYILHFPISTLLPVTFTPEG
jgi:hypothetical protein